MADGEYRKPLLAGKSAEELAGEIDEALQGVTEMTEDEEIEYDAQWGYFDDE